MGNTAENLDVLSMPEVKKGAYVDSAIISAMLEGSGVFTENLIRAFNEMAEIAGDTSVQSLCGRIQSYYFRERVNDLQIQCVLDMCSEPNIFSVIDPEHISRRRFLNSLAESLCEYIEQNKNILLERPAVVAWGFTSPIEMLASGVEASMASCPGLAEELAKSLYRLVRRFYRLGEGFENTFANESYLKVFPIIRPLVRSLAIKERTELLIRLSGALRERFHNKNRWIEFARALDTVMQYEGGSRLQEAYRKGQEASSQYSTYLEKLLAVKGDAGKEDALFADYCDKLGVDLSGVLINATRALLNSKDNRSCNEALEYAYQETSSIFSLMMVAGAAIYDQNTVTKAVLSLLRRISQDDLENNTSAALLMLLVPAAYFSYEESISLCEGGEWSEGLTKKWETYSSVLYSFVTKMLSNVAVSDSHAAKRALVMKFDSPVRSYLGFGIYQISRVAKDLDISADAFTRFEDLDYSALANTWVLGKELGYHLHNFKIS